MLAAAASLFRSSKLLLPSSSTPPTAFSRTLFCFVHTTTSPEPSSSFTLHYLINSWGLSPDAAASAAAKIQLHDASRPDSVLRFLKAHHFTQTQISCFASCRPKLLLSNVDRTLSPKFNLIQGLGIPPSDLRELIASNPILLTKRFDTQILPSFKFLKEFVRTNENVVKALKRSWWLLASNLEKCMRPNIDLMREHEVPDSQIVRIIITQPRMLLQRLETLSQILQRVEELGFERKSWKYILAVHATTSISRVKWEAKCDILKGFGLSLEEIMEGFKRMPLFMTCSEKKLQSGMHLLVNKLKLAPSAITWRPLLLMFSIKKRILPRARVWWILRSKDVVEGEEHLLTMLNMTEDAFLKRCVKKYETQIPYLLKAYKGEMDLGWLDTTIRKDEIKDGS